MKHDEMQRTYEHVAEQLLELTALLTEYNSAVRTLQDRTSARLLKKKYLSVCIHLWEQIGELEIRDLTERVRQLLTQIECHEKDAAQILWALEGLCAYNDGFPEAVRLVKKFRVSGRQYRRFCDEWSEIWNPRQALLLELPDAFSRLAETFREEESSRGSLHTGKHELRLRTVQESCSSECSRPHQRRIFCPRCGSVARDNQQFCLDCGSRITSLSGLEMNCAEQELQTASAGKPKLLQMITATRKKKAQEEMPDRRLQEMPNRRLQEMQDVLENLRAQTDDAKNELERLYLERDNLTNQVNQHQKRSVYMREWLKKLQCENDNLEKQIHNLESIVDMEEERYRALHTELKRRERDLEELYQYEACLETNLNIRRMERPEPSSGVEIARVFFSALAPKRMTRGVCSMIHVVMYEKAFRSVVDQIKAEADEPLSETPKGAKRVRESSRIRVVLTSADINFEDNMEEIWDGAYLQFPFAVAVPADYEKDRVLFHASVYVNGLLSSTLQFMASCSASQPQHLRVYRRDIMSAFVSYAHQDRKQVATLVMGIRKARPDMDIFFDITALRSGDRWEPKLKAEIEQRDILYLCWSRNACASRWVEQEWRYALEIKGPDAIEPLPLEMPDQCPPPEELQHMHFQDNLLFVINAS